MQPPEGLVDLDGERSDLRVVDGRPQGAAHPQVVLAMVVRGLHRREAVENVGVAVQAHPGDQEQPAGRVVDAEPVSVEEARIVAGNLVERGRRLVAKRLVKAGEHAVRWWRGMLRAATPWPLRVTTTA